MLVTHVGVGYNGRRRLPTQSCLPPGEIWAATSGFSSESHLLTVESQSGERLEGGRRRKTGGREREERKRERVGECAVCLLLRLTGICEWLAEGGSVDGLWSIAAYIPCGDLGPLVSGMGTRRSEERVGYHLFPHLGGASKSLLPHLLL